MWFLVISLRTLHLHCYEVNSVEYFFYSPCIHENKTIGSFHKIKLASFPGHIGGGSGLRMSYTHELPVTVGELVLCFRKTSMHCLTVV